MRRIGHIGLALALCLALALPLMSQAPPQPAAKNRTEYDAYIAFYNDQNPQTKITAGEKFLSDHAGSDFTNAVAFALGNALQAAQQSNNFDKIMEYGDKTLANNPNDLNAQMVLSALIPERLPPDGPAKTQAINKAMDLANKAHDQVEALFKGAKPADVDQATWDAQRTQFTALVHATLGLIHYTKGEYNESIAMYETVVPLTPKDQRAWLLIGIGYGVQTTEAQKLVAEAYEKENAAIAARADQIQIDDLKAQREALKADFDGKLAKTVDALAKAVAVPDMGFTQPAREQLQKYYRVQNADSLDGMDAFIAQKKAELGV
jgi:tetratricopeptide (TPR) repeat protein